MEFLLAFVFVNVKTQNFTADVHTVLLAVVKFRV